MIIYTIKEDPTFVAQWKQITPAQPDDPTPEDNKQEEPKKKGGVNTGDTATPILWALLLMLSALLYAAISVRRNLAIR